VSLSVRTLGRRGPVIVLLHGLASSNRYWGHAYDALAQRGRLVIPDLLGFGASPRPPGGYGPDEHADAVVRCLRDIDADHPPVLLVGHSVGALVALRIAARFPHMVCGVVGFGPPIYRHLDDARHHLGRMGLTSRLFGLDTRWAEIACRQLCERRPSLAAKLVVRLRPDLPRELAADAVEHSWASYSETLTRVVLAAEASHWLEQIDAPVLFVVGSDDAVCDLGFLGQLVSGTRVADLLVLPGAGHDLPLVKADACRAEIGHQLSSDLWCAGRPG
jgi:pimeloyl-ACP methyl ester carboxylesterase